MAWQAPLRSARRRSYFAISAGTSSERSAAAFLACARRPISRCRHLLRGHQVNREHNIVTNQQGGAIEYAIPGDPIILTVQRGSDQKPSARQSCSVLENTNHLNWQCDLSRYTVKRQLAGNLENVHPSCRRDRRALEAYFRKLRRVQNVGGAELLIEPSRAGVE